MENKSRYRKLALAVGFCIALPAHAVTVWNESSAGDLSNDGLIPTAVSMAAGSNIVLGTTGNPGSGIDRDYFKFTVPVGSLLSAITLLDNTIVSGASSFIGIQAGDQLTVTPSGGGAQNLIGFSHYGNDLIGQNLLPTMAPTFIGGLPSGTYSVWVQELGGTVDYGFDFVITPVPEPSAAALLLAGVLGLAWLRRR